MQRTWPTIDHYRRREPSSSRSAGGRQRALDRDGPYPLVSVITATFNSAQTIDRTIDSVRAQTYPHLEYLVIDGGSSDATIDRLRDRAQDIDLWISEPDDGIADAFNKGIALASGAYVTIVNSDDWLEATHISCAVSELQSSGADFVFGDMTLHARDGRQLHVLVGEPRYAARISHSMPSLNHPTVVCARRVYEELGLFDPSLKVAMDYEWFLRVHRHGVRGVYTPRLMGHLSLEGASDRQARRGFAEVRDTSIRYGYSSLLAWSRFAARVTKLRTRQILEPLLPQRAYERLRRRINPHYRGIGSHET